MLIIPLDWYWSPIARSLFFGKSHRFQVKPNVTNKVCLMSVCQYLRLRCLLMVFVSHSCPWEKGLLSSFTSPIMLLYRRPGRRCLHLFHLKKSLEKKNSLEAYKAKFDCICCLMLSVLIYIELLKCIYSLQHHTSVEDRAVMRHSLISMNLVGEADSQVN